MATKAQLRQLEAEWKAMLKKHSRPLEKGAGGKMPSTPIQPVTLTPQGPYIRPTPVIPSLSTRVAVATVPLEDPLRNAKRELASKTGQLYNKGGVQYLSDGDMQEQRSGAHRRR